MKEMKKRYLVEIDGESYSTYALSEHAAISNIAFRYAQEHKTTVALVMYKINLGEISAEAMEDEE